MSSEAPLLKPDQQIKASLDLRYAKHLVELRYGLRVSTIEELDAYDDRNYYVLCEDNTYGSNPHVTAVSKDGYVLKIVNSLDSQKTGFVEAQNELLIFLSRKGFTCPIPVSQTDGTYHSIETLGKDEQRHVLRLLVYQPGEVLSKVSISPELLKKVGLFAARLDKALEDFSHPAYEIQTSLWTLTSVPKLRDFMYCLTENNQSVIIENIVANFEEQVLPIVKYLDKGLIHGDLNEHNIIAKPDGTDIAAIIDFGDSHKNCLVFELAVCLCYMITSTKSITKARHVIEGYQVVRQLTQQEKQILKLCVCARMAQSLVLGVYSYQKEPDNFYLIRDHKAKWALLNLLWPMSDDEVNDIWGIKN